MMMRSKDIKGGLPIALLAGVASSIFTLFMIYCCNVTAWDTGSWNLLFNSFIAVGTLMLVYFAYKVLYYYRIQKLIDKTFELAFDLYSEINSILHRLKDNLDMYNTNLESIEQDSDLLDDLYTLLESMNDDCELIDANHMKWYFKFLLIVDLSGNQLLETKLKSSYRSSLSKFTDELTSFLTSSFNALQNIDKDNVSNLNNSRLGLKPSSSKLHDLNLEVIGELTELIKNITYYKLR